MRPDLQIVAELVNTGARVLDLGCGSGELLAHLHQQKQVRGYGLEIDPTNINICIKNGVNVIEQDLDKGLDNFADQSFDMVVMTETLQSVRAPALLLDEMLRIGQECIVTFPNFGYWRARWQLITRGRMPIANHLPHSWFDTPNIHLCTFRDFEDLCDKMRVRILDRSVVGVQNHNRFFANLSPNLFGATAFYRLGR